MKNSDMPAIPCDVVEQYHIDASQVPCGAPTLRERKVMSVGMTKREMMAMHMMASIITQGAPAFIHASEDAVNAADALLAELERTK